jgi:pilus assembly protein CpaB
MAKRSNTTLIIGLAVFVVGAGATFLIMRGGGGASAAGSGHPSVLVAAKAIPAGTSGANAVNGGFVAAKAVSAGAKPSSAYTDPSQLAGTTAVVDVTEGQVLSQTQFQQGQTRLGTLKIPDGKTALAIKLGAVPGVAGFVAAGDKIDIYGAVKEPSQAAHLVTQNTEVLKVNAPSTVPGQPQSQAEDPVFLLAVTPAQAESLVYLTTFEKLYFSLVTKDQPAIGGTPGSSAADPLKLLP